MHFTNKPYQYLSCEIVLARPVIWIIIPRRNIISVHIALHLRTRAGGRPMLLHRLWENFHRNVNLNFTWEISLRRSHINVPTVTIRSYLTHKKDVLVSDPITHSVQDTHPNEWLLTEYISDIRPNVEGQLINHTNSCILVSVFRI